MIKIQELKKPNRRDLKAINALLPQLSTSAKPITMAYLKQMVSSKTTTVLVGKDGARIVGMGTLVLFPIPVGVRARIEDVVVEEAYRGQGLGGRLMQTLVALAKTKKAPLVDFTSSRKRKAANALYRKLGFELRETNVYRKKLK